MTVSQHRRQTILTLIGRQPVRTQEELVDALAAEGIEASQASVSRDVAALGLVKRDGRYAVRATATAVGDPLARRLRERLLSIQAAGPCMVVLKTTLGEASGLALAIDETSWPEVVGTLAGDDTIFVATPSQGDSAALMGRLRSLWGR